MSDHLEIVRGEEMSAAFEDDWVNLFARAYQSNVEKGRLLLRKYKINKSRLCVLYVDERMVGSYSGLELTFANKFIFLSTDTMSDGTRRGASVEMGKYLYEQLTKDGFLAVCGYPNDNIRKLRQKRLEWIIDGKVFLWVGVPFFWGIGRNKPVHDLWRVNRPKNGFFGPALRGINLVGRDGLFQSGLGFACTIASQRPSPFFFRVPAMIFEPRTFGYRFLIKSNEHQEIFLSVLTKLDLETIDIP
jgi:hypothetical protein